MLQDDTTLLPRRIPFRGAVNFRDLGGYRSRDGRRIRHGLVYRSDSLCQLDAEDHELLRSLGLRTICDFRVGGEKRLRPDRLPDGHGIDVRDLGLLPRGSKEMWQALNDRSIDGQGMVEEMHKHYRLFVLEHSDRFREMFDLMLTDGALPMLLHCASGKDRTGFAVSLVLSALDVDWETIAADYVVSDRYRRDLAQVGGEAMQSEAVRMLLKANPEYLEASYRAIDENWDGLPRYFEDALGLGPVRLLELRERLLEPA